MRLNFSNFNLKSALLETLQIIEFQIKQKQLELKIDFRNEVPVILFNDEIRFKQILLNLLSNALKFTFKGGIEIKIKKIERVKTIGTEEKIMDVRTSVRDSGIGIKENESKNLFS